MNCRICGSTEHDYEFHFIETVTIALSLGDAEALEFGYVTQKVQDACKAVIEAALEAQHEYDNSPELQALLRKAALEGER